MFIFGDPSDTARLYLDNSIAQTGPTFPDKGIPYMTEYELRVAMTYFYGAVEKALLDDAQQEVLAILTAWYDAAFQALAERSEAFVEKVASGAVFPPGGPSTRSKYLALAGLKDSAN